MEEDGSGTMPDSEDEKAIKTVDKILDVPMMLP